MPNTMFMTVLASGEAQFGDWSCGNVSSAGGAIVVVALGREAVPVGAITGKCNRANWRDGGTGGSRKHKHRKDSDFSPKGRLDLYLPRFHKTTGLLRETPGLAQCFASARGEIGDNVAKAPCRGLSGWRCRVYLPQRQYMQVVSGGFLFAMR